MLSGDPRLPQPIIVDTGSVVGYWDVPAQEKQAQRDDEYDQLLRQRLHQVLELHARAINGKLASVYDDPVFWMES